MFKSRKHGQFFTSMVFCTMMALTLTGFSAQPAQAQTPEIQIIRYQENLFDAQIAGDPEQDVSAPTWCFLVDKKPMQEGSWIPWDSEPRSLVGDPRAESYTDSNGCIYGGNILWVRISISPTNPTFGTTNGKHTVSMYAIETDGTVLPTVQATYTYTGFPTPVTQTPNPKPVAKFKDVRLTLSATRHIKSGVPFVIQVRANYKVSGTCTVTDTNGVLIGGLRPIKSGKADLKVTNYWVTGGRFARQSYEVVCDGVGWLGRWSIDLIGN